MNSQGRSHERDDDLPAGDFATWMVSIEGALDGSATSEVPCDGCTACCRSAQFIHIAPTETDALAHIPAELLFPAPGPADGMEDGHVVMGYDEHGRCPMLHGEDCSIYPFRPHACRTYDCRVFAAAGVDVTDDKPLIAERTRRWRFSHATDDDVTTHEAVGIAATFIERHQHELDDDVVPHTPTQLAITAIEGHRAFVVRHGLAEHLDATSPSVEAVAVEVRRHRS